MHAALLHKLEPDQGAQGAGRIKFTEYRRLIRSKSRDV